MGSLGHFCVLPFHLMFLAQTGQKWFVEFLLSTFPLDPKNSIPVSAVVIPYEGGTETISNREDNSGIADWSDSPKAPFPPDTFLEFLNWRPSIIENDGGRMQLLLMSHNFEQFGSMQNDWSQKHRRPGKESMRWNENLPESKPQRKPKTLWTEWKAGWYSRLSAWNAIHPEHWK